jgi:hypothetical protein
LDGDWELDLEAAFDLDPDLERDRDLSNCFPVDDCDCDLVPLGDFDARDSLLWTDILSSSLVLMGDDASFIAMLCDCSLSLSLSPPFSCSTGLAGVSSATKRGM